LKPSHLLLIAAALSGAACQKTGEDDVQIPIAGLPGSPEDKLEQDFSRCLTTYGIPFSSTSSKSATQYIVNKADVAEASKLEGILARKYKVELLTAEGDHPNQLPTIGSHSRK
jgi:hypothetical protein